MPYIHKAQYEDLYKSIEKLENLSKNNKVDLDEIIQAPASRVFRTQADVQKFRSALDSSESVVNPTYYNLQQIYNEVVLDTEVSSSISVRKNYVLSRLYTLTKDDAVDEKATDFFSKRWTKDFINFGLDGGYYGYSLIRIGDIVDDELSGVSLVPRQNTNPKTRRILETPYQIESGESIDDKSLTDWLILATDSKDTHFQGLLSKVATPQILLKIAQGGQAEYGERFGSPNIIVKTGMYNKTYIDNVERYLKDFNRLGYGIFSNLDEIQLVESSGKSSDIYTASIEEHKSNIRKAILGSATMGNDNTWAGTSEVNEGISDMISQNDMDYIEYLINDELIPRLVRLGLKFLKGVKFKFDVGNKMKTSEEFAMTVQLLQLGYTMDSKDIYEKYGIKVNNPIAPTPLFPEPTTEEQKPTDNPNV